MREHLESFTRTASGKADDTLSSTCFTTITKHLLTMYAELDTNAKRWQGQFLRATIAVYLLAAVAVTIAIGRHLFLPEMRLIILLEVLVMLVALGLIQIVRRIRLRGKWLDARHLAEHLRTAMFLTPIPQRKAGAGLAEFHELPFYPSPLSELQESVREALTEPELLACSETNLTALRRFLGDGWMRYQAHYHQSNAEKKEHQKERGHRLVVGLFSLTLFSTLAHFFHLGGDGWMEHLWIFLSIALPAWAAATHGLGDFLEWERLALRSDQMHSHLEALAQRMDAADDLEEVHEVANLAQRLMADENHEWVVSILARPEGPVVPT